MKAGASQAPVVAAILEPLCSLLQESPQVERDRDGGVGVIPMSSTIAMFDQPNVSGAHTTGGIIEMGLSESEDHQEGGGRGGHELVPMQAPLSRDGTSGVEVEEWYDSEMGPSEFEDHQEGGGQELVLMQA